MTFAGARDTRHCRRGAIALSILVVLATTVGSADARARRHHHHRAPSPAADSYEPSYASIVVDANSGAVMQATNADSLRHPASLTKIMTLYLLFERLEQGKIKFSTEMVVSPHAAAQAPSKLNLQPGETITVENAIRAIVTKSANDVAVVVAEALGGSEPEFAKLMTAKARALGMLHTNYHNASGLPDEAQITTARDMAILGRAIHDRFPQYYHYFSTRSFAFRGHIIRSHNHLLGAMDGVDGIKTGYIRESGFNIVTSVHRDNHYLVAVVFGGHTASARDARVRSLIENNINIASTRHTAPLVVEGWATTKVAAQERSKVAPSTGSTAPIVPTAIRTVTVEPGAVHSGSLAPLPADSRKLTPTPADAKPVSIATVTAVRSEAPLPLSAPERTTTPRAKPTEVASAGPAVPVVEHAYLHEATVKPHGDWMIQVGAFDTESEAKQRLTTAQIKVGDVLAKADPLTEKITTKGDKSLYRARFAGLGKSEAQTACRDLKRSKIPCLLLKN